MNLHKLEGTEILFDSQRMILWYYCHVSQATRSIALNQNADVFHAQVMKLFMVITAIYTARLQANAYRIVEIATKNCVKILMCKILGAYVVKRHTLCAYYFGNVSSY